MMDDPVAFVNGGDGSMVLDHEIVFVCDVLVVSIIKHKLNERRKL